MPILQPHDTVHELGFSPLRNVHFSGIPLTLRVHFYGYSLTFGDSSPGGGAKGVRILIQEMERIFTDTLHFSLSNNPHFQ